MKIEMPNYTAPPIPEGYKYVSGEWKTGFTIKSLNGNFDLGDYWTWVPVGCLRNNGTLDGKTFNLKFGRRNYNNEHFCYSEFNEKIDANLTKTLNTIDKYGGFYISSYLISQDEDGFACSGPSKRLWTNIDFETARHYAGTLGFSYTQSHLCYGAEIDSLIEWGTQYNPKVLNDLCLNTSQWTMERYGQYSHVVRGSLDCMPLTTRTVQSDNYKSEQLGFRATLYIP